MKPEIDLLAPQMQEMNRTEEAHKRVKLNKPVWQALLFRMSGLGLIFLLQVLLARLMGPKHYGDYTVIITVVNLFVVLSVFGFDSSVLRFLPAYLANKEYGKVNGFVKFSYRSIAFLAILSSIGLFIFLLSKSKQFGNIAFNEGFLWGLLVIPFLAFIYQSSSVLRALGKIKTSLLSSYFLLPFFTGLACYRYYFFNDKLTVDAAMLNYLCCTILICLFINRRAGKVLNEKVLSRENSFYTNQWISVSSVLFLTTALELLLRQSDILMVSYFLGNTKAGQYGVAAKLAVLASLGLSVADYVLMPKISALFEKRQFSKLQQLVRNSSLQILSITLPVVLILVAGGRWILGLFGTSFTGSYVPLIILLAGQVINASTGMVGGLMMMTGHQKYFLVFYVLAFIVQFILNVLLIPAFGIIGASVGSSLSIVILNLLGYWFVKRNLKIKASFF